MSLVYKDIKGQIDELRRIVRPLRLADSVEYNQPLYNYKDGRLIASDLLLRLFDTFFKKDSYTQRLIIFYNVHWADDKNWDILESITDPYKDIKQDERNHPWDFFTQGIYDNNGKLKTYTLDSLSRCNYSSSIFVKCINNSVKRWCRLYGFDEKIINGTSRLISTDLFDKDYLPHKKSKDALLLLRRTNLVRLALLLITRPITLKDIYEGRVFDWKSYKNKNAVDKNYIYKYMAIYDGVYNISHIIDFINAENIVNDVLKYLDSKPKYLSNFDIDMQRNKDTNVKESKTSLMYKKVNWVSVPNEESCTSLLGNKFITKMENNDNFIYYVVVGNTKKICNSYTKAVVCRDDYVSLYLYLGNITSVNIQDWCDKVRRLGLEEHLLSLGIDINQQNKDNMWVSKVLSFIKSLNRPLL